MFEHEQEALVAILQGRFTDAAEALHQLSDTALANVAIGAQAVTGTANQILKLRKRQNV